MIQTDVFNRFRGDQEGTEDAQESGSSSCIVSFVEKRGKSGMLIVISLVSVNRKLVDRDQLGEPTRVSLNPRERPVDAS